MSDRMLSGYPEPKIKLGCKSCPRKAQYDVEGMLSAGGDRRLLDLLDACKERLGCPHHPPGGTYDPRCQLVYLNGMPADGSAYAAAKGR